MYKLAWPDTDYADLIPEMWFVNIGVQSECQHNVVGPRGGRQYVAKCSVSVRESTAELDYRPFKQFNEKHDMDAGVLRLEFTNEARTNIARVFWWGPGEDTFKLYDDVDITIDLEAEIEESLQTSSIERQKRLIQAPKLPERVRAMSIGFRRNPDVIASVLLAANGICQGCGMPAPFKRASNGRPYLEVHHRRRLADGGEDTVENAIALCPNCHRKAHFG